jgi:RHS repeat-associated protein
LASDGLGNWSGFDDNSVSQSREVNAANEIQTIDSSPTVTYDQAGNMTSDGTLNYQYDAWNRLVRVTSNGNWNVNGYIYYADYAYDGRNRRIEKVVYRGSMMLPVEHYYYNQYWQMLEDRVVVDPFGTCGSTEYIWSPRYVDSPIVSFYQDLYHPQFDNVRYYATDANHNVTATIDGTTGDVVNRYSYTAYGKATEYDASWSNAAAPTADGPLYCGYFFDAETANHYCRNRYLSTALGTFINRDPIASSPNLYAYCDDNAVNATDSSGLEAGNYLNDAKRKDMLACAANELQMFVAHGWITAEEMTMRLAIIKAALNSKVGYADGPNLPSWRNPDYWETVNGEYQVKNDKSPCDAILDMVAGTGGRTKCRKAAELVVLAGTCNFCEDRSKFDDLLRKHPYLPELFVPNGPIGDLIEMLPIAESDFIPGDQTHMINPNYVGNGGSENGPEGTNKIYVCANYGFVDPYGKKYYSYEDMQQSCDEDTPGHPLSDYYIDHYFRPRICDTCK